MLKRAQENGGDQEVDAGRKEGREVQPEAGRPADSDSQQPGHRCCSVTARDTLPNRMSFKKPEIAVAVSTKVDSAVISEILDRATVAGFRTRFQRQPEALRGSGSGGIFRVAISPSAARLLMKPGALAATQALRASLLRLVEEACRGSLPVERPGLFGLFDLDRLPVSFEAVTSDRRLALVFRFAENLPEGVLSGALESLFEIVAKIDQIPPGGEPRRSHSSILKPFLKFDPEVGKWSRVETWANPAELV